MAEAVDLGDAVALRGPAGPSFRWGDLLAPAEPLRPGARVRGADHAQWRITLPARPATIASNPSW